MARKSKQAMENQKKYQHGYNRRPEVMNKRNAYVREWCKKNPEKRFMRYFRHRLKKKYGMTPDQFYELAKAFNGDCFICRRKMILPDAHTRIRNGQSAVIDHDHKLNSVRGMICNDCNRALGLLRDFDSVKRAVIYLDCYYLMQEKQ